MSIASHFVVSYVAHLLLGLFEAEAARTDTRIDDLVLDLLRSVAGALDMDVKIQTGELGEAITDRIADVDIAGDTDSGQPKDRL